jgi:2-polyprenyl-6-methoxyphenol hydroxylase-like FAD-dependent oxidoreductase
MSAGPELPSRNLSVNKRSSRRIAVLGGGLQGCCIALALAQRGAAVHLYDREPDRPANPHCNRQ